MAKRKDRPVTLRGYISSRLLLAVIFFSLVMLVLVKLLAEQAVKVDAGQQMRRFIRHTATLIDYDEDRERFTISNPRKLVDEGMYFLLLDIQSGEVILGSYPEELSQLDMSVRYYKSRSPKKTPVTGNVYRLKSVNGAYFMLDSRTTFLDGLINDNILVRCVVAERNISSSYRFLLWASYGVLLLIIAATAFFSHYLTDRIAKPLEEISRMADAIGRDKDISRRMSYQGRFVELEQLCTADNRMLDRLEATVESHRRFSSDVAHELRNPLAVIIAECEYAGKHTDQPEEMSESLEVILRQAKYNNEIVKKLLRLNRLNQADYQPNLEYISIAEIVQSVCEDAEGLSDKPVQITVPEGDIYGMADIDLMTMAVWNLVNNAIKYSPDEVFIKAETTLEDGLITIRIADRGQGIPKEEQDRIFDQFYRTDKSRNSEGFGLGLPLVRRIAQIHGGDITVDSTPGEGSVFTLQFPRWEKQLKNKA